MARMKFMNTEIDNLTMQETLQAIDQLIQENKRAYVVTPNVDHIVQLETNRTAGCIQECIFNFDRWQTPAVDSQLVWHTD